MSEREHALQIFERELIGEIRTPCKLAIDLVDALSRAGLTITPQAGEAEPVVYMYEENGETYFGHPDGHHPLDATPLYRTAPPQGEAEPVKCQHCAGTGEIEPDNNGPIGPCPMCNGKGSYIPRTATPRPVGPIPMILFCPSCGLKHIDAPQPEKGWTNPPHRSHECQGCGLIWRPADIETTGVYNIQTRGKNDSAIMPTPSPVAPAWRLVNVGGPVRLDECPIGLFIKGDELCLKTEYGNNEGRIDAYIVSSGEFFWGGQPQTIKSQRANIVQPVDVLPPSPPDSPGEPPAAALVGRKP